MPDFTSCPQCHTRYRTAGMPAGKRLRCKKCRALFVVSADVPLAPTRERADESEANAGREADPAAESDSEHALPAALGDRSSLSRANFSGGVSLPGSSAQGTFIGLSPGTASSPQAGGPADDDERYVVEDEIARGGMGAILRAVDRDIRREVAMKVMLDDADERKRARFVEEAQVTGQLEHPNIVPVHELGVDAEGRMFFTMKLVQGRSLAEVLKEQRGRAAEPQSHRTPERKKSEVSGQRADRAARNEPMPLGRLLNAFINICNAMAFAHAKGVVHRDLKPANVMLGDFGEVLVMDWGLAKVLAEPERGRAPEPQSDRAAERQRSEVSGQRSDTSDPSEKSDLSDRSDAAGRDAELRRVVSTLRQESGELTQDGTIIGTPHYMPPEQADGAIEAIDARSDIYSLGAILYEILTLKPPVEGNNIYALMKNVSDGNITPPDQRTPQRFIPKELSAITMKALAKSKDDRYQRAEDLRRDIELFIEGRAVSAKPDTTWETIVKLVKRNRGVSVATAAALTVVLVLVGIGYWLNLQERRTAIAAQRDAEAQRSIAEVEKQKSDKALASYKAEQQRVRNTRFQSAPAFLENARQSVTRKDFDGALAQVDIALEYLMEAAQLLDTDSDERTRNLLAEGWLLKGQLLVCRREYAGAQAALDQFLNFEPSDENSLRLRDLCRQAQAQDSPALINALAELLTKQRAFVLATTLTNSEEKLFALYRQRICAAWPNAYGLFRRTPDGKCSLNLASPNIKVLDLKPLAGIPLAALELRDTKAFELEPLRGMPLTWLHLAGCREVKDLTPLTGMKLRWLDLYGTRVSDLTPLQDMPLGELKLAACTNVTDISVLRGMPLTKLNLAHTRVSDISPLKGMPLTWLDASGTQVCDISPLAGMRMTWLELESTQVADISVLQDMPLTNLGLGGCPLTNPTPLKGLPLSSLNLAGCPIEDISILSGMRLAKLQMHGCRKVRDLIPLQGMPLVELWIQESAVSDLEPLRGMPLNRLLIEGCGKVQDVSPLQGMQIGDLQMAGTAVSDLSPLEGMSLKLITITPHRIKKGWDIIRKMNSIKTVGTSWNHLMPAAEFWKRYDAGEFNK